MISLSLSSISSKIQAILDHDLFIKDVDLFLSFAQTLWSSQIPFCSLSSLQIIAHISSCPSRPASVTSVSILSKIQVVSNHDLFVQVEDLSSRFP